MSLLTDKDRIGDSGEHYVTGLLMTGGLFIPKLFGGKTPSFDVFAMINDENCPFPLLIQVKTTEKQEHRYNKTSINTPVPDDTIMELAAMPIPTYVAGYDLEDHILYIAPVFSGSEHYPSIPLKHKLPLNDKDEIEKELTLLKKDVQNFFVNKTVDIQKYKKSYKSQL